MPAPIGLKTERGFKRRDWRGGAATKEDWPQKGTKGSKGLLTSATVQPVVPGKIYADFDDPYEQIANG